MYKQYQVDPTDETAHKWDAACTRYRERMAALSQRFPPGVIKFLDWGSLHDATVDKWTFPEGTVHNKLQLVLQQENWGDYKYTAILRYDLAQTGRIDRPALVQVRQPEPKPAGYKTDWLYDEFDELSEPDNHGRSVFSHRVLLSSGAEFEILFTDFSFLILEESTKKSYED
jgi:hypothetical protein